MHAYEQSKLSDLTERLQIARHRTWEAVEAIAAKMEVGMSESEARQIGQRVLASMGSKKFWHKCHVRFGSSTVLSFDDDYTDAILKEEDIFYIDIGPIWDGIEGDAGATFVRGNNPHYIKCKQDAEQIFQRTADIWRNKGLSGPALYKFAEDQAEQHGWILAPSYVRGHRLGEFPHSFYTESTIQDQHFIPAPARWVLEIQICNHEKTFGAFYEDILQ